MMLAAEAVEKTENVSNSYNGNASMTDHYVTIDKTGFLLASTTGEVIDATGTETKYKAYTNLDSDENFESSERDQALTKMNCLPALVIDTEVLDKEHIDHQLDENFNSSERDQTVIQTTNSELIEQKNTVNSQSEIAVAEEDCTVDNGNLHDSKFDNTHVSSTNNLTQLKKRHLSSSAEYPTTPKRLKSIEEAFQGKNILSPIEDTISFQKERHTMEAFGETPTPCEYQDIETTRRPVSSTPLVQNLGKSKMCSSGKVILRTDHAEIAEEAKIGKLFDNRNLSIVRNDSEEGESTLLCENLDDVHDDERKVVIRTGDELESDSDKTVGEHDTVKVKIFSGRQDNEDDFKKSMHTDQNKDNSSHNIPVESVDTPADIISTSLPITDGSYFSQSINRPEGRFKNVEASISNIDLEEDILLSEDVLGLENDYDDSEIDEETLLAGDSDTEDGNKENLLRSNHFFNTVDKQEDRKVVSKDIKAFEEVKPACEVIVKEEKAQKSIQDEQFDLGKQAAPPDICSVDIEISSVSQNLGKYLNQANESVVKVQVDFDNGNGKENKPFGTQLKNSAKTQDDISKEKVKIEVIPGVLKDTKAIVCSDKTEEERETVVQNMPNENASSCKSSANTYPIQSMDTSLLFDDINNSLVKEVKKKWKTDSIPSQDINLTAAVTYHQKYSGINNSRPAMLEGEKISCLNFYEEEIHTTHPKINHHSLNEALMKLRKQKEDLDKMKLSSIHSFEQKCMRRSRLLKTRHRDEFEQLHRR